MKIEDVYDFILAGKAKVVFHNERTGNTLLFRVSKEPVPDRSPTYSKLWFVHAGHDRGTKSTYVGFIRGDVFIPRPDWDGSEQQANCKAFRAMWQRIVAKKLDPVEATYLKVYHIGACGHCGRELTNAESIKKGIGPECYKKVGL